MKLTHNSSRLLAVARSRSLGTHFVGLALTVFWATSAYSALFDFDLDWSGASFGNAAVATGTITLDDAILLNPGLNDLFGNPGYVTSFSITVSGASSGNGSWNLADYSEIAWLTDTALDLSQELVGQPTSMDPWGTSQPGGTGGDFNLFDGPAGSPQGTFFFELTTNNGSGDPMLLTSFRPVPEPAGYAIGLIAMGIVMWRRFA